MEILVILGVLYGMISGWNLQGVVLCGTCNCEPMIGGVMTYLSDVKVELRVSLAVHYPPIWPGQSWFFICSGSMWPIFISLVNLAVPGSSSVAKQMDINTPYIVADLGGGMRHVFCDGYQCAPQQGKIRFRNVLNFTKIIIEKTFFSTLFG